MSAFFKTLLFAAAIIIGGFLLLGFLSYRSAGRFSITGERVTLATATLQSVRQQLSALFGEPVQPTLPTTVPILMYHYIRDNVDQVGDSLGYALSLPVEQFTAQLAWLQEGGYQTVHLADLIENDRTKKPLPKKPVVLTFDDGYKDFLLEAQPLLARFGFSATIFIINDRLNDSRHLSENDVIFLANRGYEIGSHSVTHPNLTKQPAGSLWQELIGSRLALEGLTLKPVTTLSYPAGQYNERVMGRAAAAGYQIGVTTQSGLAGPHDNLLALPRQRIRRDLSKRDFLRLLDD